MNIFIRGIIVCIISLFYTGVLFAVDNLTYNLLTVDNSPNRTWINWISINDTSMTVNISANNLINDSLSAGWMNLDPNTFLEEDGKRYKMTRADGIALAPNITRFNHSNQTITFNISFPRVKNVDDSFNLIENDSSEWRFSKIKFHKLYDNSSKVFYAPHTFSKLLYSYSDSLMRKGEFEKAIEINSGVVSYITQKGIKADNLLATLAYSLAGCYNQLHNDSSTSEYSKLVIELYKNNSWKEDISLARMYGVLADVYARNNNFPQAINQGEEALKIKKANYPNGSLDLALTYGKLAYYYEKTGDYNQAISLAENGLLIREKYANGDLINRLPVVLNLCRNYFIKQKYSDAYKLALAYKTEQVRGADIDTYIQLCAVCSHSQHNLGNTKSAKNYAKEGYGLMKEHFSSNKLYLQNFLGFLSTKEKIQIQKRFIKDAPKNESYFSVLQNLAADYFEIGDADEAIKLQELCQSQRVKYSVHDVAKECEGQNHLLTFYLYAGNIDNYHKYKENCLRQTEDVFGKYSYEYADLLRTNFTYYYDNNYYYEAIIELNKMLDIYKYLIIRDFSLLSFDDREMLWRTYNDWFDNIFLNCHIQALNSNTSKADELNALLFDNVLFSKGLLLNSQIAHNAHKNFSKKFQDIKQNGDSISAFLRNGIYGSYSDIIKKIDHESIAIEFIVAENTGEIIALCLLPDKSYPRLVFICKENELNELINNKGTIDDYNNLIWGNLSNYLKGIKKIYVSLDGILNVIPIENYARSCSSFEPNATVYRLSSTRNITHTTSKEINNYLLVGGLDYEHNGPIAFDNIPETNEEINEIAKLLDSSNLKHTILKGSEGTKEYLESQLQNKFSAIHLATHSYYWKESKTPNKDIEKLMSVINQGKFDTDKRLIRSGIVLSSNNKKTSTQDTGLLSSYEIANLNLRDVQLIVLPNCKSGSGDISKDGIIGLQRAFKEAQVGTMLMSLWNADDIATRLLMVEFYRNYMSGKSIHCSLQDAQNYIKNYEDENGNKLFESPYYWAGFIILD